MNNQFTVFGSRDDLASLEQALKDAGFKPVQDAIVHASEDDIPAKITFIIVSGVTTCLLAWLKQRGKRVVTRMGDKITIKGDYSAEETERLLQIPYNLNIEDDAEPSKESSNSEKEMGFHVREKPPEKL